MARDKKLREVLDSLSGDPARSLPAQDRELMESVLRRLKIQENRRLAEQQEEPIGRSEEEMAGQELEALREQQQHDSQEMQRLQEERERLLAHQTELEERLARLEAASHGGPLSYVEDEPEDETVEFSRVDLDETGQEELLEFTYKRPQGGFDPDAQGAWEEEPGTGEAQWGDWPDPGRQDPNSSQVDWDDEEGAWADDTTREAPAQAWETQDTPRWDEEPTTPVPAGEHPPWSEDAEEDTWPPETHQEAGWEEPAPAISPPEKPGKDLSVEALDDRTRAELEDLERQLAQLEQEIERRGGHDEDDEENA